MLSTGNPAGSPPREATHTPPRFYELGQNAPLPLPQMHALGLGLGLGVAAGCNGLEGAAVAHLARLAEEGCQPCSRSSHLVEHSIRGGLQAAVQHCRLCCLLSMPVPAPRNHPLSCGREGNTPTATWLELHCPVPGAFNGALTTTTIGGGGSWCVALTPRRLYQFWMDPQRTPQRKHIPGKTQATSTHRIPTRSFWSGQQHMAAARMEGGGVCRCKHHSLTFRLTNWLGQSTHNKQCSSALHKGP
jgi:hypothetical protein